jgi:pimeloyl-ACP methyl ester carboxylesterase
MHYPGALPKKTGVGGLEVEYLDVGAGPVILYLHSSEGADPDFPLVKALAKSHRVIMPAHPGFGLSETSEWISTVDDLSYAYLDLIEALDLRDITVVGSSLGGWLAVELATKGSDRIERLVLDNPLGLRFQGKATDREFPDVFQYLPSEWTRFFLAGAPSDDRNWAETPEDVTLRAARNREAFVKLGWSRYLHNPKLKGRLHRVKVPTLVLWGDQDGLASRPYAESYTAALPNAQLKVIPGAGHFAFHDKPDAVASAVLDFARKTENA